MTRHQLAGTMLRMVLAIGLAGTGISAASAQTGNSVGAMQMAPGAKMDMKGKKMPAKKSAHHRKAMHHKSTKK